MRSAAELFYVAVFAFMGLAEAEGHGSKTIDMANKCAVSEAGELQIATVVMI